MHSKFILWIALLPACLYALFTIFLKQALIRGTNPWKINFFANLALWVPCLPLWFFIHPASLIGHANLALWSGLAFTTGQIFTFLALQRGDASVATPLLGVKVLVVTFIAAVFFGQSLQPRWWEAAALCSLGIFFVTGSQSAVKSRDPLITAVFALTAAVFFGLSDVLLLHAGKAIGTLKAIVTMFSEVGLLTLLIYPMIFGRKIWILRADQGLNWFIVGLTLLTIQSLGFAACIVLSGDSTAANVLYSSRCVWSVLLAWLMARYLGYGESDVKNSAMFLRMLGAFMLFVAILIVLI